MLSNTLQHKPKKGLLYEEEIAQLIEELSAIDAIEKHCKKLSKMKLQQIQKLLNKRWSEVDEV